MNSMVKLFVLAAAALTLAVPTVAAAAIPAKTPLDLTVVAAASGDSITVYSTRFVSNSFWVYVSGGWRTDGPCDEYVPAFKIRVYGIGLKGKQLSIPAVNTIRSVFVDSDNEIAESNENNNTRQVPDGYVC